MNLISLAHLASRHIKNSVSEEVYLTGLADLTRPVAVYGLVNTRCNYKCRYCEYWRKDSYPEEMSVDEWQTALLSLKDFIGPYHIEFSGGEPYIKKGFMDLTEFCHRQGIHWGVTTNGSAFTEKVVRRTVAALPFNVNVSIDSSADDVHDYCRGIPGSLKNVTSGLRRLTEECRRARVSIPIIIKPVVHRLSYKELPELVSWAVELGATSVNFQPVDRWTKETYEELWIEENELKELERVALRLREMKRMGAPILNSDLTLSHWGTHFREESAPKETLPCRVGLRNFFIRSNGDVEVCWHFPPIGNLRTQTARAIWTSKEAKMRRKETVACTKLCLFTCLSQRTLMDKARMATALIVKVPRGRNR